MIGTGTAILAGSVLAGGATVYGASRASRAAREASQATAEATREAIAKEWEMYQQAHADYAPWREAGGRALSTLEQLIGAGPGEFKPEETPGYKFGFEEFVRDPYLRAQGARGKRLSGETLKGLTEYATGYAETNYQNFLNRYYAKLNPLAALSGVGAGAAGGMGQAALGTGANIANLTMQGGQMQAQNLLAQGNIATGMSAGLAGVGQSALGNYTNYMTMKPFMEEAALRAEMLRKMGVTSTPAPYAGPMAGMY